MLFLALAANSYGNYTITPLIGNVYIEEQAKVHLFHETWKLIIGINFTSNSQRLQSIHTTIGLIEAACNNKCSHQYEIHLVRGRYNRLTHKINILNQLLGKQTRTKRGLANFVGDISKTLFGTLSETDLEQINSEFDKIYMDNTKIASVLRNHTKILKLILDSSSVNHKELLNNQMNERKLVKKDSTL